VKLGGISVVVLNGRWAVASGRSPAVRFLGYVAALPEVAGGAALLVDPRSVDEIAMGIASLWTDPARRRELSDKGRARASCFTWERTARDTAAVYEAVLS